MPESSVLDFKASMYAVTEDKDLLNTAKLVKDIVSFSNTIRNETAYILIGISERENGFKEMIGIDKVIDDAILQDKVKDKVHPRPKFLFYTLKYNEKLFGVFEIPVTKYSLPISPSVKMKGLEVGRIYYRSGTTNAEAMGYETIAISKWLESLPNISEEGSLFETVNDLLKRLSNRDENLSVLIAEILGVARKHKLDKLISFCSSEIQGYDTKGFDSSSDEYQYRVQRVKFGIPEIELNPYMQVTESMVKNELEKNKDFHDLNMFFPHPLIQIEEYLNNFISRPTVVVGTIKMNASQVFPNWKGSDSKVLAYVFKSNYEDLCRSIRQKTIDELMKIHL